MKRKQKSFQWVPLLCPFDEERYTVFTVFQRVPKVIKLV